MTAVAATTIPEDGWQDASDDNDPDGSRLVAWVTINGVDFHLTAIEVSASSDTQEALYAEDDLIRLYEMEGANEPFYAMTIRGRSYVVWAAPFCN